MGRALVKTSHEDTLCHRGVMAGGTAGAVVRGRGAGSRVVGHRHVEAGAARAVLGPGSSVPSPGG
jgi:hypothetical protein